VFPFELKNGNALRLRVPLLPPLTYWFTPRLNTISPHELDESQTSLDRFRADLRHGVSSVAGGGADAGPGAEFSGASCAIKLADSRGAAEFE
jgi:hypothetical protein